VDLREHVHEVSNKDQKPKGWGGFRDRLPGTKRARVGGHDQAVPEAGVGLPQSPLSCAATGNDPGGPFHLMRMRRLQKGTSSMGRNVVRAR